MDKAWVEQKNAEQAAKLDEKIAELRAYLKDKSPLFPSEIEQAITYILKAAKSGYYIDDDLRESTTKTQSTGTLAISGSTTPSRLLDTE